MHLLCGILYAGARSVCIPLHSIASRKILLHEADRLTQSDVGIRERAVGDFARDKRPSSPVFELWQPSHKKKVECKVVVTLDSNRHLLLPVNGHCGQTKNDLWHSQHNIVKHSNDLFGFFIPKSLV